MITECFSCSSENEISCKFCHQCGKPPNSTICSKCKAQCSPDFKFCSQCGTPVSGLGRQAMSCFDTMIDENDAAKRCHLMGNYIIRVSATGIELLDSRQNAVYSWPRAYIRRYGVDKNANVLIIDVGRKSESGEGQFRFLTDKASEINDLIYCLFSQSHNPALHPIFPQEVKNRQEPCISDKSERNIQLGSQEISPVSFPSTDDIENPLAVTRSWFDVTVEDNDSAKRCRLTGNYVIYVSAWDIRLLDSRHKVVYNWPCSCIRRYGVKHNDNVLIIDVGRRSDSGEGQFRFRTRKAQGICNLIKCLWGTFIEAHNPLSIVASTAAQELGDRREPTTNPSDPFTEILQSNIPFTTTNNTGNSSSAIRHCFDITIAENGAAKRCHLKGNYIIRVSVTGVDLLDSRQNVVYSWPRAYIRRYGVNNNTNELIIDVGRRSVSGEGQFRFQTLQAHEIYDLVHGCLTVLIE